MSKTTLAWKQMGGLAALLLIGSACASPTRTAAPTATSIFTLRSTPSPTPLATPIPTSSPTLLTTPTPTPSPTIVPTPLAYPNGDLPKGTAYVRYGSRQYPVVAITIDDCYSPAAVAADQAIFEQYHVNVTWFPIGYVAALHPDLWRAIDAAGFPIANHTYDHKNLTVKTYAQIVQDIKDDNYTLKSILGHPIMPFVRPYGGALNDTVIQAAAAAGERAVVNWDSEDGDASGSFAQWSDVSRLISLGEGGKNGSIILMHANHEYTTQALPTIINYYRSHGFQFVTLGQLLGVPGPVPYGPEPATWRPPALTPAPTATLPY
jgi:peptidoglycan/xylan/chitin deacetylase (PgdA/CDA1 family)